MNVKKSVAMLLAAACLCSFTSCADAKTSDEWKAAAVMDEYHPNKTITGNFDARLAAKCVNGTFVGKQIGDVTVWKGIPFAEQPVGDLRFRAPKAPAPSNRVYEAYHFMKSGMQSIDPDEKASVYEQGEECLGLNIWKNTQGTDKKPVLVFIHGGGWMSGGTADSLYNGYNFANDNPDILVVTVDYRLGMLGQIDLSSFPDGAEFKGSEALCMLDLVQSLKWIKENIAAFGGDPDNVTISGESAGGGAVSMLCVMPEARGLFTKAIPMSGSVTQFNDVSNARDQIAALRKEFGANTVKDLQRIPFPKLKKWWGLNVGDIYHHPLKGNSVIEADPLDAWVRGDSSDITIMQGHTANEFRYYITVFGGLERVYDAVCKGKVLNALENGDAEYAAAYREYNDALRSAGRSEADISRAYMDDYAFNAGMLYQAEMHAKNGGKGFFYTFEKGYDGDYSYMGAAHAIDCFYMFGSFDGNCALGTDEEVELSRKFQRMIANFCKTGDPSTDGLTWPEYKNDTKYRMMIGMNMRAERDPESERNAAVMKMMSIKDSPFLGEGNEKTLIEGAAKLDPEAVAQLKAILMERQK